MREYKGYHILQNKPMNRTNPEQLLREKRKEILKLCAKYGAHNVRVFGSVACGEANEKSDITYW